MSPSPVNDSPSLERRGPGHRLQIAPLRLRNPHLVVSPLPETGACVVGVGTNRGGYPTRTAATTASRRLDADSDDVAADVILDEAGTTKHGRIAAVEKTARRYACEDAARAVEESAALFTARKPDIVRVTVLMSTRSDARVGAQDTYVHGGRGLGARCMWKPILGVMAWRHPASRPTPRFVESTAAV